MKKDSVVSDAKNIKECMSASRVRSIFGNGQYRDVAIVLDAKSEGHLNELLSVVKRIDGVKEIVKVMKRLEPAGPDAACDFHGN